MAPRKIAVVWPRDARHIGIEASAFLGVHRGIDPRRRCRTCASHAVTLNGPTDIDWRGRVAGRHVNQLLVGRAGPRVGRRARRT